jgi:hypothetical protein
LNSAPPTGRAIVFARLVWRGGSGSRVGTDHGIGAAASTHARGTQTPPLTLVVASLVSASAAVAGLDVWVAIAAAAAAVLSGAQLVRTEIVVPARTKLTLRSAVPVWVARATGQGIRSTAVQYKPGRWLTAAHAVPPDGAEPELRFARDDWVAARVVYRDDSVDLAVLDCPRAYPWMARLTLEVPEEGEMVRVIGWAASAEGGERAIRIALDYVVQSETDTEELVVTGPNPQLGFSGAPAVMLTSGRTLGVLVRFNPGRRAEPDLPAPLQEVYVAGVRSLPEQLR